MCKKNPKKGGKHSMPNYVVDVCLLKMSFSSIGELFSCKLHLITHK